MVRLSNTVPRKLIRLPITELRIDRVTLLIVTYPVNNNALMFPVYCMSEYPLQIRFYSNMRKFSRIRIIPARIAKTAAIQPLKFIDDETPV